MKPLKMEPNVDDPDGFYAELLDAHAGPDREAGKALNARLILANHIGDRALLHRALAAAKDESHR